MKKIVLLLAIAAFALVSVSCKKERTCRCSVIGDQTIRLITIDKGDCRDIRYVLYDKDPVLYPDLTDSVLCTDFDFEDFSN